MPMTEGPVYAVILVHNAFEYLPRIVEGIRCQTHPVDGIVLVDNGSEASVRAKIRTHFPDIDCLFLEENVGVGAGHNAGWRYVLAKSPDGFIWSFEHDVIPDSDCLEQLFRAWQAIDSSVVAAACPVEMDGLAYERFRYFAFGSKGWQRLTDKTKMDNYFGGLSFNGLLLPASTIRDIGYLREDFFVGREDIDYFKRIWAGGKKILRVTAANVQHNLYKNRRQIRWGKYIWLLPDQSVFRQYYAYRNAVFMKRQAGFSVFSTALKLPAGILFSLLFRRNKRASLQAKWYAFLDGIKGDLGKKDYWFLK